MTLFWLVFIPLLGGFLAWAAERFSAQAPRYIALFTLVLQAGLLFILFTTAEPGDAGWLLELSWSWIPRFGIGFHLAVDGASLLLLALTVFLGFMAVGCSWTEIRQRSGFFHFNLLWTLAGVAGVFLAMDLFLFFCFWEVMLIPMYFLISVWGHENRAYAAMKFFIFTQVSGLMMLVAILALVYLHHRSYGALSFDYPVLLKTGLDAESGYWLMLGFFIAFAVKLPAVPFHTWLPDAHTQAPTGGSVILAGVLLKTGAYGLLRFVIPLFPEAAREFSPLAMSLGAVSILYAAKVAFAQTDLKRLIAYTSVSHMGFVLLGAFSHDALALQGAVMTMLAHGISAAALFMVAGALQERLHTREMPRMGGFWAEAPRLGAVTLFFSVAALGMPGLGNFIGEFLVLVGAYQTSVPITALAGLGLIVAPIYALSVVQQVLHGPLSAEKRPDDFRPREMTLMLVLMASTCWLGLYPNSMLGLAGPSVEKMLRVPSADEMGYRRAEMPTGSVSAQRSTDELASLVSWEQTGVRQSGNPGGNDAFAEITP